MSNEIDRRRFIGRAGLAAAAATTPLFAARLAAQVLAGEEASSATGIAKPSYGGPNVIIVRFGGGVRRSETIDPNHTYSPFLCHELTKRGTLFKEMVISEDAPETGHGQGTLNILTGIYDQYKDVGEKFLGARFEARVPTVFEYLRKAFAVPEHQTLIINGEDRTDEEF